MITYGRGQLQYSNNNNTKSNSEHEMPSKRTTSIRRKDSVTSYPGLGEIPVREDLLVSKRAARGREMEERRARKVDGMHFHSIPNRNTHHILNTVLPIDHELLLRFQDGDKEACDMLYGQKYVGSPCYLVESQLQTFLYVVRGDVAL